MREVYGIGDFRYEYVDGWGKLPEGIKFQECPGVAVDPQDNVYVLTRGEHPIMVFDRDGNYLRSFGQGLGRCLYKGRDALHSRRQLL